MIRIPNTINHCFSQGRKILTPVGRFSYRYIRLLGPSDYYMNHPLLSFSLFSAIEVAIASLFFIPPSALYFQNKRLAMLSFFTLEWFDVRWTNIAVVHFEQNFMPKDADLTPRGKSLKRQTMIISFLTLYVMKGLLISQLLLPLRLGKIKVLTTGISALLFQLAISRQLTKIK